MYKTHGVERRKWKWKKEMSREEGEKWKFPRQQ